VLAPNTEFGMTRIINTANPGKLRHQARRTIAEVLRHLMPKEPTDPEAKDMAACVVYALRDIAATVDTTVEAWENRDYYLKADRFRIEWEWAGKQASQLERLIRQGRWSDVSQELAALATRFSDIRIARATRDASTWLGSYERLIGES
jgi:hypothetical protein